MEIRFMSKDDEIVRSEGRCAIYDERSRGLRRATKRSIVHSRFTNPSMLTTDFIFIMSFFVLCVMRSGFKAKSL